MNSPSFFDFNYTLMNFYILAGGQSRRLGRNKALVEVDGQTIIEKVLSAVPAKKENIKLVTSSFQTFRFLNLKVIPDIHPGLGPIGGVHAGLVDSPFDFNFFLACDLPLISVEVIQTVLDSHAGQDIFGISTKNGLQPLCTIYSRGCILAIERQIKIREFSLHRLFETVPSEFIAMKNCNLLFNVNTKQDLEDLKKFSRFSKEPS